MSEYEFYQTNDLAMVSYLRVCGHQPVETSRSEDNVCEWKFQMTGALMEQINDFSTRAALVEPREFSRQYGIGKNEMYRTLNRRG